MSVQMQTMRQIQDANGILSDGTGRQFPVRFDLTETQDFYAAWPGPVFSYGDIRFNREFDRSMLTELELDSCLWLSAPGFAAKVHLQGERFTVVRSIEHFDKSRSKAFVAA